MISSNEPINAFEVFTLIKNVFVEMGRCRKVYYYQAPSNSTQTPEQIAAGLSIGAADGTWAYFKKAFAFPTGYGHNTSSSVPEMYETIPANTTNWNNNTTRATNSTQIQGVTVNNLIQALQGVEQQMTNFGNEWANKNNVTGWWSGSASDTSNNSNKVFFVKYWWCHSNCHSNCHTNRSRR